MYKLNETSVILDINGVEGRSIKELEAAERKFGTNKYSQDTMVSTAFMKHIVNEGSNVSKSFTSMDERLVIHTIYFPVSDAVEKVTYKFIKQ